MSYEPEIAKKILSNRPSWIPADVWTQSAREALSGISSPGFSGYGGVSGMDKADLEYASKQMMMSDEDVEDDLTGYLFALEIGFYDNDDMFFGGLGGWEDWKKRLFTWMTTTKEGMKRAFQISGVGEFDGIGEITSAYQPSEYKNRKVPSGQPYDYIPNKYDAMGVIPDTFYGPDLDFDKEIPDTWVPPTLTSYAPTSWRMPVMGDGIGSVWSKAKSAASKAGSAVKSGAKKAASATKKAAKTVAKGVSKFTKKVLNAAKSAINKLKTVYDKLKAAVKKIAEIAKKVKSAFSRLTKILHNQAKKVMDAKNKAFKAMKGAGALLATIGKKIKANVTKVQAAVNKLKNQKIKVKTKGLEGFGATTKKQNPAWVAWKKNVEGINSKNKQIATKNKSKLEAAKKKYAAAIKNFGNRVKKFFSGVTKIGKVLKGFTSKLKGFSDKLKGVMGKAKKFGAALKGVGKSIKNAFAGIGKWFKSAGAKLKSAYNKMASIKKKYFSGLGGVSMKVMKAALVATGAYVLVAALLAIPEPTGATKVAAMLLGTNIYLSTILITGFAYVATGGFSLFNGAKKSSESPEGKDALGPNIPVDPPIADDFFNLDFDSYIDPASAGAEPEPWLYEETTVDIPGAETPATTEMEDFTFDTEGDFTFDTEGDFTFDTDTEFEVPTPGEAFEMPDWSTQVDVPDAPTTTEVPEPTYEPEPEPEQTYTEPADTSDLDVDSWLEEDYDYWDDTDSGSGEEEWGEDWDEYDPWAESGDGDGNEGGEDWSEG